MDIQNNTENKAAIHNEQQLDITKINQNLLSININLKSIAESLDKIANKGVDIFSRCSTTNN